jgi:integrase
MTPDRTAKTIEDYRRRADQIRRQAAKQLGIQNPRLVSPLALVEHLIDRREASRDLAANSVRSAGREAFRRLEKKAISRGTWRQYKGSLLFVLEEEREEAIEGVVAEELDEAIARLRAESQSGCLKQSDRTSGLKAKAFPAADFEIVANYLESRIGGKRGHRHANALLTFLRANRLVGLRPAEWESAGLVDLHGALALRVGNAKHTNGRANGSHRHLLLDGLLPKQIGHLDEMLHMLVNFASDPEYGFDRHMHQLRLYMGKVVRRCLGKRKRYPSMYSFRHQFVANAKSGSRSQEEIAALVGHGSNATASQHYGRTTAGEGDVGVTAVASEVATVRHSRKATGYRPALRLTS